MCIIVTCTVLQSCPLADGAAEVSRHFLNTQYIIGLQGTDRDFCHCFVTGTGYGHGKPLSRALTA